MYRDWEWKRRNKRVKYVKAGFYLTKLIMTLILIVGIEIFFQLGGTAYDAPLPWHGREKKLSYGRFPVTMISAGIWLRLVL